LTRGCNNQLFWGGRRTETRHNNIVLKSGANSRQTTASLAPKHNNQQKKQSFTMAYEVRSMTKQRRRTSNNRPKKAESLIADP
jgi:hypothetical protein